MVENRGKPRDSLFLLATLRIVGESGEVRARVRNLSPGGMMAECVLQVLAGERVEIEMRNIGQVTGTVAWASESRFGVAFDREIDTRLVRRQPVPAQQAIQCVRRPPAVSAEPPVLDRSRLRPI